MSGSNLILLFDRELPFSDGRHLYNHVNYLLRTDPFQRWTNTATRTCRAWIPSSPSRQPVLEFFGGSDERDALKERLLGSLKGHFQTTDLSSSGAYRSLFMARLVPAYLGPDGSPTADVWQPQDAPGLVTSIAARFAACAAADLMCMVSHVDQDECDHLHALFSWDGRKPRGRSRLDVIFGGDAL